jgi:PII-like signaling protein
MTVERALMLSGREVIDELPYWTDQATKLTLYLSRHEKVGRTPAFAVICELFQQRGVAGASTLLGVDGTARGRREQARFFARNAEVPVMVVAVGTGESIAGALPDALALVDRPLATFERVRVCKRDGQLIGRPHSRDNKLTIFTSESQLHHGRPIHRVIMRRLRESGAGGATTVRGIWGYHGDHAPHGDRSLQIGRRVPTLTTVIDTPERIVESFAIIDEVTEEHGLVTSEVIA